jgi:hypothetical protein
LDQVYRILYVFLHKLGMLGHVSPVRKMSVIIRSRQVNPLSSDRHSTDRADVPTEIYLCPLCHLRLSDPFGYCRFLM